MWDRIRERVGGAGLIVAIVALVLAVAGGAYAAGGGLTGKQKKQVEKISKKFAGKPGTPGPAGANGKDGANGVNGKNGAPGANGANGEDGKSITAREALPTECEERGGAILEDEGEPPAEIPVCTGKEGPEGQPWTPSENLPANALESGAWSFTIGETDPAVVRVAISFPIRLAATLGADKVHFESQPNFGDFDEAGSGEVGCKGTQALPNPPVGHLCIYGGGNLSNAKFVEICNLSCSSSQANRSGALIVFEREASGSASGSGSFAVRGFPSP